MRKHNIQYVYDTPVKIAVKSANNYSTYGRLWATKLHSKMLSSLGIHFNIVFTQMYCTFHIFIVDELSMLILMIRNLLFTVILLQN